jgi:hypothetical protein
MALLLRALSALLCFQLGVLLVFVPWSGYWERNFFLERFPVLIPLLLNPFFRGAVTGLGLLDILIAAGIVFRRRPSGSGARE